jgi:predicted 3-demethylubiquinone-9 3-methyltransferase (glyoxalase superfamily)
LRSCARVDFNTPDSSLSEGVAIARGSTRGPGNRERSAAMTSQRITPFLWYASEAEEAAAFYTSIFPDSRVLRVTAMPSESPSGPPGSVKIVDFVLLGQRFTAMSAGPLEPFNHAVSFVVHCDTQAEIDRYWNALLQGGAAEQCGWLKDRFGVSWQIVPSILPDMIAEPDRAKAKRAADAMLKMVKIDIAALQAASGGTTG